ncbi:MAG: hypothetical protein KAJ14_09350, partial [Candidatus Omnitrophica bacterium]|nr:hypothetical protein [Candidatus Omnitrophota bacterium]
HQLDWSLLGTFNGLNVKYKVGTGGAWVNSGTGFTTGSPLNTDVNTHYDPLDNHITLLDGSNKIFFRVEDTNQPASVNAETPSAEGNEILGSIELLEPAPNAYHLYAVGETVPLRWKKYGNIGTIKIELYVNGAWQDNGTVTTNLTDSYASGDSGESGVSYGSGWLIPDIIGDDCKIRLTTNDPLYPTLTYQSVTAFEIKGGINSVADPLGGIWYVGEDHTITWDAMGTMSAVNIDLIIASGEGAGTYNLATNYSGPPALQYGVNNFTWSALDIIQEKRNDTCKIRVTSVQNLSVLKETNNSFTLKPKIVVTTPVSSWIAESTSNTIEWDPIVNPTSTIDIILIDGDAGFTDVALTPGSGISKAVGSYVSTVQIPSILTPNAKIRIQDHDIPSLVYGESNSFKIIGDFVIDAISVSPDTWKVGDTSRQITWTAYGVMGSDARIYVDYDYPNGWEVTPLATNVDSSLGFWDWPTIPDEVSNNVRIMLTDGDKDTTDTAIESETFSIIGGFSFAYPLGDETFNITSTNPSFTIKWNTAGTNITAVKLEYWNKDSNGGEWLTIKSGIPNNKWGTGVANENTYTWDTGVGHDNSLPLNLAASNIKFRILASTPDQPDTLSESNTFNIVGGLAVTSPTQGAKWTADGTTANTISWNVYGPTANVRIKYSRDSKTTWITIAESTSAEDGDAAVNKGAYLWTIPVAPDNPNDFITRVDDPFSHSSYFQIEDADGFDQEVTADSLDFIVKGQLRITAPDVIAGLNCASSHIITCERDGRINAVNIRYSSDGGITYPNTIESDISFSPVDTATQVSTAAQWLVPETPLTLTYKIMVEDANYKWPNGTFGSTVNFRVKGALELTAPMASETWRTTEQKTISWDVKHGNMSKVKIMASPLGTFLGDEYSIAAVGAIDAFDAGDPFDEAKLPTKVGSGSYVWTIPETTDIVNTMRFKVVQEDAGFTDIMTGTSAPMDIRGTIVVQTPTVDFDNGLDWNAGETNRQVKFTPYGTDLSTVYIFLYDGSAEYQIDGGSGVATAGDGNEQTVTGITVPDVKSHSCVIRVRDDAIRTNSINNGVEGSSGIFSAYPVISNVVITPTNPPDAVNSWVAESTNQIVTWSETGTTITSVDVWYSTSNVGGLAEFLTNITTDQVCNTITVPAARTVQALIRIQDNNANFKDYVQADTSVFNVYGTIETILPDVNSVYEVGSTSDLIKWTYDGDISLVNIYVDYNYPTGGWTSLVTNVAVATGASGWTWEDPGAEVGVGDHISNVVKVKVTDADYEDNTYSILSDTFSIVGGFTFQTPLDAAGYVHHIDDSVSPTPLTIEWISTGLATTEVKLEYYNGSGWTVIKNDVVNNGDGVTVNQYNWGISSPGPLPLGDATQNAKIRISGSTPLQPISLYPEKETSPFTLCGDLAVTAPIDSDVWIADGAADKTISWDVYGKVDNVRIDYTRGGTGSWITIVASTNAEAGDAAANKGLYDWTLPTTPNSGDYITKFNTDGKSSQIRIFDQDANFETFVQDISSGFIVKGQLTIVQPADVSAGLNSGALQAIEWQRDGRINAVNVKYSTDGGSTYPNIIQADRLFTDDATTTQTTSSQWLVPETPIVTTYKLLVEDTEYEKDAAVGTFKESDTFRVKGALELTAPIFSAIWRTTEQKTISWDVKHGNMSKVKIMASPLGTFLGDEYSIAAVGAIDAFDVGDPFNETNLPDKVGSGSYVWTIPETIAIVDTMKFKVVQEDAGFADIMTDTSAAMDIRGIIVVQTPTVDFDNGLDWNAGET